MRSTKTFLVEDDLFASGGAHRLEDLAGGLGPIVPAFERANDGFHVSNALHLLGMAACPVETEPRSPIVNHQEDLLFADDRIEPCVQVTPVVDEAIAARALARVAHSDEVGRQAASDRGDFFDHVAPQVRRGRVAVEEDRRRDRHRRCRRMISRCPRQRRVLSDGGLRLRFRSWCIVRRMTVDRKWSAPPSEFLVPFDGNVPNRSSADRASRGGRQARTQRPPAESEPSRSTSYSGSSTRTIGIQCCSCSKPWMPAAKMGRSGTCLPG